MENNFIEDIVVMFIIGLWCFAAGFCLTIGFYLALYLSYIIGIQESIMTIRMGLF